jgi:hypothetical protein
MEKRVDGLDSQEESFEIIQGVKALETFQAPRP